MFSQSYPKSAIVNCSCFFVKENLSLLRMLSCLEETLLEPSGFDYYVEHDSDQPSFKPMHCLPPFTPLSSRPEFAISDSHREKQEPISQGRVDQTNCTALGSDAHGELVEAAIAEARRVVLEEAKGLEQLARMVGDSFPRAASILLTIPGRVIITGLGKSGHIGRKIASTLSSTGTPAFFLHPGDLNHGDLGAINRGDTVVILSRSGDVPEIIHAVQRCHRLEIPIIAITAKASSKLAEAANITLLIPDIAEACPVGLAPTTSAVCMLAMGDALAMYMMRRRNFGSSDFRLIHPGGNIGRRGVTVREVMAAKKVSVRVPTLLPNCGLTDALPTLLCSQAGMVGVVDESGKLVDALTDHDVGHVLYKGQNETSPPRKTLTEVLEQLKPQRFQNSVTIDDYSVHEDDHASTAVAKMTRLNLRGVFIVDEVQYPIGFLSLSECLEAGLSQSNAEK